MTTAEERNDRALAKAARGIVRVLSSIPQHCGGGGAIGAGWVYATVFSNRVYPIWCIPRALLWLKETGVVEYRKVGGGEHWRLVPGKSPEVLREKQREKRKAERAEARATLAENVRRLEVALSDLEGG